LRHFSNPDIKGNLKIRGTILDRVRTQGSFYSEQFGEVAYKSDITSGGGSGFYGITVKHSDDSASFRGLNVIAFEVDNFYLTQNSPNTDEVIVNFRGSSGGGGGGGETNTASNLGSGEGVFSTKVGPDLRFKSLVSGDNIALSSDSNEITITANIDKFYGITAKHTDDSVSFTNLNVLNFNVENFYLTQNSPNTDEVVINFRGDFATSNDLTNLMQGSGTTVGGADPSGSWDMDATTLRIPNSVGMLANTAGLSTNFLMDSGALNQIIFDSNSSLVSGATVFRSGSFIPLSIIHGASSVSATATGGSLSFTGTALSFSASTGDISFLANNGSFVYNDNGMPSDFRIESDTLQSMFFVDGSANGITIGASAASVAPTETLDVHGSTIFRDVVKGPDETVLDGNTKDVTWDWSTSNNFHLLLRRPTTLHTPTNIPAVSSQFNLVVEQPSSGFYNITFSKNFLFPGGGQLTPTQSAGAVDLYSFHISPTFNGNKLLVAQAANLFY